MPSENPKKFLVNQLFEITLKNKVALPTVIQMIIYSFEFLQFFALT